VKMAHLLMRFETPKFRAECYLELINKTAHNCRTANYLSRKLVISVMEVIPFSGLVTTL
jgi:hypothetical protein